jgi:hypothetical protein
MKFQSLLIVSFFLIFTISKSNAQTYVLGKVTVAELEEKAHPKDSTASAAILFSKGIVKIGDNGATETSLQRRIKIYKKEGYQWANLQAAFAAGKLANLSITDLYTYNLVDGNIVKSKVKPEGEFIEKNNQNYWVKKNAFPDIKEGSIIEFQLKKHGGLYIQDWNFQEDIPVNYSEFKTIIPDAFVFKRIIKGFLTPKINSQMARTYGALATETIYVLKDVPAMKEESYVNNINNYRSGILYEMETIAIPGQITKSFSSNWPTVVRTIYDYENFGTELNKTGYFDDDLKLVLKGKINPDEKIIAILDYVKSNIKWNNNQGYVCEKGVRKAYKEKSGNCGDINLMLTAMLRYSGLNANPVLISTRSNGIAYFPTTDAFNYVIAAVETPQGNVLLDATEKFSTTNILPLRDLNWIGRLIRKDGTSEEVDLMPVKISNNIVSMSYDVNDKGDINGKIRRQISEYNALNFRNDVNEEKESVYLEKFENENNKIELSDYKRTNEKELLLPVIESFSFVGANLSEVIGDKIYINPMLFFLDDKNPFKQEEREYPIDFGFPFVDKYNISIKIPDNYTVEILPKSLGVVMEDNIGVFKFDIAFNENRIQLSIVHQINDAVIPVNKYEIIKEYYKQMIAKESEKIILKRI